MFGCSQEQPDTTYGQRCIKFLIQHFHSWGCILKETSVQVFRDRQEYPSVIHPLIMGSSETMNVGTRTTCISHISSADIMVGNNNKNSKQYEHTI